MRPNRSWPIAVLAALALLLTGCTEADDGAGEGSVRVHPGKEAMLTVPDGPSIKVPAGAVSREGTLRVEPLPDPPAASDGTVHAPAWDIHLDVQTSSPRC
jgi:hypothetical protein